MSMMRQGNGMSSTFRSGVRYFEAESSFGECALCLSIWTEPKEIAPCRHIYCKECIGTMDTCPQCRGPIERLNKPNPVIERMLDRIPGKCSACSWTGTRHQYLTEHKTCEPKQSPPSKSSKRPAAAPPIVVPSSPLGSRPKATQPTASKSGQDSPLDGTVSSLNATGSSEIAAMVDRYAEYFMEGQSSTGTATQSSGQGTMSSAQYTGSGSSPGRHVPEWDRLRELQAQQNQHPAPQHGQWNGQAQDQQPQNYNGTAPASYMWSSGRPAAVTPPPQQQQQQQYQQQYQQPSPYQQQQQQSPYHQPQQYQQQQQAPSYQQPTGQTNRRSSNARVAAAVAATSNPNFVRTSQPARTAEWKQDIVMTASDYGLSEKDFNFLVDHWTEFATVNERNGKPELRWRDACRILRYLNLPSHPSDVMDLFETVMQSVETGSIPFHGLCLWMALNRRDSQKWYNLNSEQYSKLLAFAQILDVDKSGLFNLDQCKSVGEEYLMRDLTNAEWQSVLPLLVEKAKDYRRQIPTLVASQAVGGTSLVTSSSGQYGGSFSPQDVKLPLHEVILLFVEFMEQHKKTPVITQDMEMARQNLCMRISHLIRYYNPSAMNTLPQMLDAFRGEEESLLETLVAEYGPEPR